MAAKTSVGEGATPDPIQKLNADAESLRREAESSLEYAAKLEEENQRRQTQISTPMTVHNLTVHGAPNTRRAFLDPILSPIVAPSANAATTLGDISYRLQTASSKLDRLGIFQPAPKIFLNSADQTNPSSTPTDVDIDILLAELPRYKFNAGTDVGNSEGSAFTSLLWRNIFGGAEQLSLNASTGTRTRSAYTAELSAPVASDPDCRVALEILSSAADKPWASHEEVLRGGSLRYQWLSPNRDMHSIEYTALWRQLTSLGPGASPTVRADAGDSLKSSLRHIFRRDTRNNPQLPQRGYHVRTTSELAGVGPLGGDVAFSKSELELGGAVPLSQRAPAISTHRQAIGQADRSIGGLSPSVAARQGPLPQGSRLNSATAVSGGPLCRRRDLLFPLPYRGPDSALRMQLFANAGRLVALKPSAAAGGDKQGRQGEGQGQSADMTPASVARGLAHAVGDLVSGPPSVAAGVGLVYAHPVARFELNFSLPLVVRRGEVGTKGVQVGVGINFL
ncbi:mitochondrial outer membrane beta-barrel protein Tob55 [Verticillium dahliae VdLs.17]|uniref:Mitochondrial outer membrane beta-barrel protein Tob55 n=1 Tax=Verticillium dahliae (strain VdLs.17 / ATCC MYA-4575 / FGSC 10137) TaxID=498257 RepID=G2XFH8_VERDV|nr:mitochondrial outer membrane beta-barrel protein Tob55 [Verticillium dahliae VdLs.17]EGY18576.1 mitochondrial outer membrane beta-barrel protein Tob55 [Verticillium dahliae VdLs.17]